MFEFHSSASNQTRCRKHVKSLVGLFGDKELEKVVKIWFEAENTKSNILAKNANFMTKNIMRSVYYFLLLTMLWTLSTEVKQVVTNICRSKQFPLITNFFLVKNENDPNSPLFTEETGNNASNNDCVKMTADRHRSSIHEATHETLSAINIQIALFIYMATFIDLGDRVFETSFGVRMPFNLGDETMTEFSSSAMMNSLIAGSANFLTFYVFLLQESSPLRLPSTRTT